MEKGEPLAEPEAGGGTLCQREGVSSEPLPTLLAQPPPNRAFWARGGQTGRGTGLTQWGKQQQFSAPGGAGGEGAGGSGLPRQAHWRSRPSSHTTPPAQPDSPGTEGTRASPNGRGTTWGPGVCGGILTSTCLPVSKN